MSWRSLLILGIQTVFVEAQCLSPLVSMYQMLWNVDNILKWSCRGQTWYTWTFLQHDYYREHSLHSTVLLFHSAVILWIQWHHLHGFKMCLGVLLCLVLLAYRCKYFKMFTGARQVTTWKLAQQLLITSQGISHAKSSFRQWMGRWVARWRPHVWEVTCQSPSQFFSSSSRIHFSLLLSRRVVEEDLFKDVTKTYSIFGSALWLK